jgi:hypothetical protein
MVPANQADQGRKPERCFVECAEKMGVRDSESCAQGPSCLVEHGSRRKNAVRRTKERPFGLY